MAKFFETANGDNLINADVIDWISRDDEMRPFAHFKDGRKPVELASGWSDVETALMPIIAAAPGHMHLRVYVGAAGVFRLPIVAWRVNGHIAHPITLDDDNIGTDRVETATLLPDGRVFARTIGHQGPHEPFPDETAWLKAVEAHWRQETGRPVLKRV